MTNSLSSAATITEFSSGRTRIWIRRFAVQTRDSNSFAGPLAEVSVNGIGPTEEQPIREKGAGQINDRNNVIVSLLF